MKNNKINMKGDDGDSPSDRLEGATIAKLDVDPDINAFRIDLTDGRILSLTITRQGPIADYACGIFADESMYNIRKQELITDSLAKLDETKTKLSELKLDGVLGFAKPGDTHIRDVSELPPEVLIGLVQALLSKLPSSSKQDETIQ